MTRYLDVLVEIDSEKAVYVPGAERQAYEAAHHKATEMAEDNGGRLRHTEPAEARVTKAKRLDGLDVILLETRWVVDPK